MSKFSYIHSYGIKAAEFLSVVILIFNEHTENETSTELRINIVDIFNSIKYSLIKANDQIISHQNYELYSKIYYWEVPKQRIKTSEAADKNKSYEFSDVDFLSHQLNTTKEKITKHTSISRNS